MRKKWNPWSAAGILLVVIWLLATIFFLMSSGSMPGKITLGTMPPVCYTAIIPIVLSLVLVYVGDRKRVQMFDENMKRLGFAKNGEIWTKSVNGLELEFGSTVVIKQKMATRRKSGLTGVRGYWIRCKLDWPETFSVSYPEDEFGALSAKMGSPAAAQAAQRLFETKNIFRISSLHWDRTEGGKAGAVLKGALETINDADIFPRPPYNGMIGVMLAKGEEPGGIWLVELEESDIEAIAEFFSAMKRAVAARRT